MKKIGGVVPSKRNFPFLRFSILIFLFLLTIFLSSAIVGCYASGPRPPIELPFAVHQASATVSTELRIVDNYTYPYVLRFVYEEKNYADRERVRKLVGSGARNRLTGEFKEPGIQIPLKITVNVIDSSGERTFLEKEILTGGLDSFNSKYYERDIDRNQIRIPPGLYRVTVQSLKNIPELANTKVIFIIRNPRGK